MKPARPLTSPTTTHHAPAAGRGGWSRQPTRDPLALRLAFAGLIIGAASILLIVAFTSRSF